MDTYHSKYSTMFLPLTEKQKKQYVRLEWLILQFNKNLKEEVTRAKDKYNRKVRGVIAEKTGVSLIHRSKDTDAKESENIEHSYIPIKIENYVPSSLLDIFDKYDDDLIELLLHYPRLKKSLEEIIFQVNHYSRFKPYHIEIATIESLSSTGAHLVFLINQVEKSGILNAINNLGPDLLGAYFLKDKRIELYWLCIGLCSILYDLPVEDFTLVVLTHELVHGYNHLGFDKDGNTWETAAFSNADLKIVEGFAQFYTEMLCKDYFDQANDAFKALLSKQSVEYTEYQKWFTEKESDKYEKARQLLLKTRKNKTLDYAEFTRLLNKIKTEF